uniref:SH2 domain containing 2A n=1 Tax=Xenopus tropicalis TaxID=8364 RepID=A0A6I8SVS1_XENTR
MNYQQDFPNVLFTTFKPLPANKEEPQRPPSADSHLVISKEVKAVIQDGDRKMESRKNEVPPSQNGAPKDNSRNPVGTLKEQTHNWFEKTQRMRLIKNGVFPEWFHGFVTRKKTEEMLEVKPPGCFLIRFCESRVGFVLSYRGAERCRHFMLDLLQDDRYVIEGEDSAHRSLQELIDHYHVYPVEPHKERLTTACAKKAIRKDCSGPLQNQADENKKEKMYSSVAKEATVPSDPKLSTPVFPEEREDVLAKIKIKVKNLSPPPRTKQPISREESLKYSVQETEPAAYALVKKMPAGTAQNKSRTPLAEDPYSTLEELHTYSDLPGWVAEDPQLFNEMQEPIAFYAMGRGSCKNNQENIYSEVDLHAVASHGLQKGSSCGATTTTHPKAINKPLKKTTPFHSSFRQKKQSTLQLEDCGRSWENSLKPLSESKVSKTRKNKKLQFDDPTYAKPIQHQVVPQLSPNQEEDPEDIYEKIKDDCVQMSKNNRSANNKPS